MNHQEKVRRFFKIIRPNVEVKKAFIVDRWLWSHGYQTPPAVAWPLWAMAIEMTLIFSIIRPLVLVLSVFFFPMCPQVGFLTEYWNALTMDVSDIVVFMVIIVTAVWTRTYFMPWKHWRQVWRDLDHDDANKQDRVDQ